MQPKFYLNQNPHFPGVLRADAQNEKRKEKRGTGGQVVINGLRAGRGGDWEMNRLKNREITLKPKQKPKRRGESFISSETIRGQKQRWAE